MQSLWQDDEAARCVDDLGLRVYTSRLLGRDKSLVLHGGGNTSVKIREETRFGETEDILYVKGSGWDLEHIEAAGFSPVRLAHVIRLAQLQTLSDPDMVNELLTHMTRAGAPAPSVETILHGCLPHKYVDHTHADVVLTLTDNAQGEHRIREIYGDAVVVIPYVMPGFDLAKLVAREYPRQATRSTIGMILLRHGIFSFGATARESYERMIRLVSMAEDYLRSNGAWDVSADPALEPGQVDPIRHAGLRKEVSRAAGFPLVLSTFTTAKTLAFARHPAVSDIAQRGPVTPDHVIRTKRIPMLGVDVPDYVGRYRAYFDANAGGAHAPKTMLDPAPRVVLDAAFGLATAGRSSADAQVVADLYDHTIDVILRAEKLGGYEALPAQEIFDVEYWDLEQAKLRKAGSPPIFAGEVALVTGAASGIGRAIVTAMHARGAAVVGIDRSPTVVNLLERPDFLGIACDVTDPTALRAAVQEAVLRYGGIDMLVLNAGIFGETRSIRDLDDDEFRRVMAVNLDANLVLMRQTHPLLKLAPRGGRVVIIGSKNVPAPGPGAAAYSASKAALTQLARVAALEWGADGIRVNTLHPNAVFDTGLWTDAVLAARAARYALTIDEYKRNNVLGKEVTSRDVAELAAEMCGPLFAHTTGAQLPIDGGNERVI